MGDVWPINLIRANTYLSTGPLNGGRPMVLVDKSGYGRNAVFPPEDAALTHVGFGTPMGELLRRYWHPVCLSSELTDLPKFLKILDE